MDQDAAKDGAGGQFSFDLFGRPVLFRALGADDHEREARRKRERRHKRDGPQDWAGQALHPVWQHRGECRRESSQQVGLSREQVFVNVVRAALAGSEEKVAPQHRRRDEVPPQRLEARS